MRRCLVRLGVVLGMLLAARDAFAADAAWDACLEGTADKMISGCTEVLSRGWGETQADLAVAYRGRGLGYAEKREYTQAIADLSEAIRLAAKDDISYGVRGSIHMRVGDLDRAIADFEMALAINPHLTEARNGLVKARALAFPRPLGAVATVSPTPNSLAPTAASVPALSDPGVRVALVIGNSNYSAVGRLSNPTRDANALAQALRSVGFKTVQVESDVGFDALRRALRDFASEAEKADWAVVYYSGHGIEVGGQNYLVPVDARLKSDRDVQFEAVSLDQVLGSIEGARKLRLVILDACRDNPFVSQMTRTVASRSIGRGLGRIEPEGGTLVAYAAKHGQYALDGDGQNSPFVSALVRRLATPGIEINKLFRLVRDDVLATTGKRQEPFVYGSLGGEDYFFAVGEAGQKARVLPRSGEEQHFSAAWQAANAPGPTEIGSAAPAVSSSYVVQLAVRPSEKEAKTAFAQLQQRHAGELAGKAPSIHKAEVNGGTVYRVRVGPMAKDDASGLCSRLQASGGQCFVAKDKPN